MISDNVTIIIPTKDSSDSVLKLLNDLSEQMDIQNTSVIISDYSDDMNKSRLYEMKETKQFPFNIEIVEGNGNPYSSVNNTLDLVETPYFLVLTDGVEFKSIQTIYNCLVEMKSSDSKIIIPKIDIQSGGISNTLIKMKFKATLKTHPFSPLSFFFAETEHVIRANGFSTYEREIDEEMSLLGSFKEDDIYSSNELVVIPNDMEIINGYLKRVKKIGNDKNN